MEWQMVVTLAVVIPVIILPAAFIWYLNIGGIVQAVRQAKAPREQKTATAQITG